MVRVKYRQRINLANQHKGKTQRMYDGSKLKVNEEQKEEYKRKVAQKFKGNKEEWDKGDCEEKWKVFKQTLQSVNEEMLGKDREKRKEWFDQERKEAIAERNEARAKMVQRKTRQTVEEYNRKRRFA
ncbi:hypothetical protein J437_LFUL007303 [Ladona fulva]|uniref:Uncharacterized protein n=1 Tax=Ladona fulva TaxID=123851 RepID=A0A8K0PAK8_LADFU|nr:hypothetical protein J437_LFUL007303 [Ladona fulva]